MSLAQCAKTAGLVLIAGLLPAVAGAATYTVGPGGTHASLHAALATALAAPGDHSIRIASGNYTGDTQVVMTTSQRIEVSGGWNDGFTLRSDDPSLTVLQSSGIVNASTVFVSATSGELHFENLTLTNPAAMSNQGTCLRLGISGTHRFSLHDSVVRHCVGQGDLFCSGNGIGGNVQQTSQVELIGNHVHDNRCEPSRADPNQQISGYGAGIRLLAENDAHMIVRDNLIENNLVRNYGEQSDGVGLYVIVYGNSTAEVIGNRIVGNRVIGETVNGFPPVSQGFGLLLVAGVFGGSGEIVARANLVADNRFESTPPSGGHVFIESYGNGRVLLGDSAIVGGVGGYAGLVASSQEAGSTTQLVNLTVADNEGSGITVFTNNGVLSLYNSLSDGNGAPVSFPGSVTLGNNRLDLPAGFVNAAGGDYRLSATSPALNLGTLTPPGDLGATDLDGGNRVVGPGVDLGAYERGSLLIFGSGFEAGE